MGRFRVSVMNGVFYLLWVLKCAGGGLVKIARDAKNIRACSVSNTKIAQKSKSDLPAKTYLSPDTKLPTVSKIVVRDTHIAAALASWLITYVRNV